ncbi:hypothetical protein KP696_31435 [Nocardia seriolae]|nr:hypothetical protein IMZ23_07560 [Nocardia seriolae]QUN22024.1 hypothetical protein KEC46_37430 [Nocardia seriolae]
MLEFSPHAGLVMVNPAEVRAENLQEQLDVILHGAVAATRAVLLAMLAAKSGTLLFSMGGGAINPYPMLATTNIAQAGLRNWVHNLHNTLGSEGVLAATVVINLLPFAEAPEGVPHRAPDEIALEFWNIHADRDRVEHVVNA